MYASNASAASDRFFTVQDAIQMHDFVQTAFADTFELRAASFSPARQYFVVLTQRGLLASHELESTIWLYRTEPVRDYAMGNTSEPPHPLMLARLAARQSYVAAIVKPGEQTFASGITNLARNVFWAVGSGVAGVMMQVVAFSAPLVVGGVAKVTYDLLLYRSFRRMKPPEEK